MAEQHSDGEGAVRRSIQVDKPSPIASTMETLGSVLELLGDTISDLETKLGLVLKPCKPKEEIEKAPGPDLDPCCELVGTIGRKIGVVNKHNDVLRVLIQRLEV